MVIAAHEGIVVPAAVLQHRRAAKLAAPYQEGIVQEASLLEVQQEGGRGPVRFFAALLETDVERFLCTGAVRIPPPVEQLHETHASLHQPPRQQAIVRIGDRAGLRAVHVMDPLRLFLDVHCFRYGHLHTESHFVLGHARQRFGVAGFLVIPLVDGIDRFNGLFAQFAAHTLRIAHIEHRIAVRAALYALVHGGQKAAAEYAASAVGLLAPGKQHDETRQVLVLRAESVDCPGPHAGPPRTGVSRVQQELRRRMVEFIRVHRLEESNLVGRLCEVREHVRDPCAAFPALRKRGLRSQHLRRSLDEGEEPAFQQGFRAQLPIQAVQFGFVVEQFELGRRAGHMQENDPLCARGEVEPPDTARSAPDRGIGGAAPGEGW